MPPERGDLLFWRGHVAMALDAERMIHANACHMAVAVEPIAQAKARIASAGNTFLGLGRLG
jgi:cell wall-associated NlpC family hydrolase